MTAQFLSLEGYLSSKEFTPVSYPELYYEIQIANLDKKLTLDLFYDQTVQEYIDLFLNERLDDYIIFRERSFLYFPMFEKYLAEYNLPPEIKYLAVLESGLSPTACSPSMAVGMWQFKEKTGSAFGLKINKLVDERTDPELSTIAACQYLNRLYKRFNNWELSLLAYNAGPTALSNVIEQNKGVLDYFTLVSHLPVPAQRYLPALVAIIYLFENYENHF
ncbi:MAG: lytic transglycosylase domain-containing protein [Bacteroidales bacterium]